MVEYKVLTLTVPYLEAELNSLAVQGWRVVSSVHQHNKVGPTIILERPMTGVVRD